MNDRPKGETEFRVGYAGWAIRRDQGNFFPVDGTHLARYGGTFNSVEINSSFYRQHQRSTYERWKLSVPKDFRFSVKLPKEITHVKRLVDVELVLHRFMDEVRGLDDKLGAFLVQLPPSLSFDLKVAGGFFSLLRKFTACPVAIEARHVTWFTPPALDWCGEAGLHTVAADPSITVDARVALGPRIRYHRLHGTPQVYYSPYSHSFLRALADEMRSERAAGYEPWAIFDNTALGHAMTDALYLRNALSGEARPRVDSHPLPPEPRGPYSDRRAYHL